MAKLSTTTEGSSSVVDENNSFPPLGQSSSKPSTPLQLSKSEIAFATRVKTSQLNPVALAPLRWNLVSLGQKFDQHIATEIASLEREEHDLRTKNARQMKAFEKSRKADYEKAKKTVTLHKRLKQMQESYENLSMTRQSSRADSLKRRLDPMLKSFYRKELTDHIEKGRAKHKALVGRMRTAEAELAVANEHRVRSLQSQKDSEMKIMRRKNKKSSNGPFTIHYAASNGEMDRLEVMLSRDKVRQDIDARDPDSGWTALHFASRGGHKAFGERLLEEKAHVNALGPDDETPLHLAAGWGTKAMVGLLLQEGADKTMVDKRGRTALDLARLNRREEIAHFLDRWMAVGLTYEQREGLSALPQDVLKDELNPLIKSQLKTLEMKIKLSGRNHVGLVHTYNKLAKLYRESEPPRWPEAIDALKRVVEIRKVSCSEEVSQGEEKDRKDDSRDNKIKLSEALNNLGEYCHSSGVFQDAKNYLQLSYSLSADAFGEAKKELIPSLRNYALALLEVGEKDDAIEMLLKYEQLMHKICYSDELMSSTMDMVDVYDLLSYAYLVNRSYKTAKSYLTKGTDIIVFHNGEDTEEIACRKDKLAFLLFCEGETKEAENIWLQAKEMFLRFRGNDEFHPDVMRMVKNFAVCCCRRRPDF